VHDGDHQPRRRHADALAREGSYAAAIYGSILATALIGALRYTDDAGRIAVTVIGTSGVFWLAHVWSELLGEKIESGISGGGARVRRLAAEEWPMVEAGTLPFLALVLAWAGLYRDRAGIDLALGLAIAQLVGWGLVGALRTGGGWARALLVAAADGAFGLAIVGLEILLH
jgi:hypothetical protein